MPNDMEDEKLIPVNVVIADRTFRVRIDKKDEELLQQTTRLINNKINEFRTLFAGKDTQDYVSMVLLWFATEQMSSAQEVINQQEISDKLARLQALLDKSLPSDF